MSLLLQDEVEGPAPPDVGTGGAEVLEQLVVAVPGLFQGVGKDAQSRPAYVPVGGVSRVVRRLGQADDGPVVAASEEVKTIKRKRKSRAKAIGKLKKDGTPDRRYLNQPATA
jgi:hypothetical protein